MMNLFLTQAAVALYANDNNAFIPELWAMEGLHILEENMVMASLVHRDFSNEVANYGDVVNTRRPGTFATRRKTDSDSIVLQDAAATNVQVPLNQHMYVSFTIKDGEASKSFQELVDIYLLPGMMGIARGIDRVILGAVPSFLTNKVGKLGTLSALNAKDSLLEAREKMNENLAFPESRNCVLAPSAETAMLKTELFLKANERGDSGRALREAALGRVLGFDTWMDQNVSGLSAALLDTATGAMGAAYAAGSSSNMDVTMSPNFIATVGEYAVIAGNGQPTTLSVVASDANTTNSVALDEALVDAVVNTAVITISQKCQIDLTAGYAAGWAKAINLDGFTATKYPRVGQLIDISGVTYVIIESDDNSGDREIWLDRPLEVAIIDGADVFPGPGGSFNLCFHRDAIALVTRPLALPANALGVRSQVGVYNNIAMRVTMQYDITTQGTVVTLDILCGVKQLDARLGCVLLG
jgi:hypothetical protein